VEYSKHATLSKGIRLPSRLVLSLKIFPAAGTDEAEQKYLL